MILITIKKLNARNNIIKKNERAIVAKINSSSPEFGRNGTTLVATVVGQGNIFYVANVGDSRGFQL